MALTEKITCDVCGTQKGAANHWMLWHTDELLSGDVGGIHFAPWHPELYRAYRHVCGESCAARLLARSIEEWRDAQPPTHTPTHAPTLQEPSPVN